MTSARITSFRLIAGLRFAAMAVLALMFIPSGVVAQVAKVAVVSNDDGTKLQVDGKDFMVNGMNWDFFPRGTNYTYSLWTQPDWIVERALDGEMSMLRDMGVNAVRIYTGVTPKWVRYIYENYGIYTVLNHSFGRYGVTLDGAYIANTDYSDPRIRQQLLSEVDAMVKEFKDVPGVLMWLLGNENNYGLFWGGAETEDIPVGETLESVRARHMYSLFGEAVALINGHNSDRPVSICNGDLLFIEIIAEEIKGPYIFGTNMYRGISFGDAFQRVKDLTGMPIFFTEFGVDAFNAQTLREDQLSQAYYMVGNWKEIYEQASGLGKVGNSIGGMTFQFSDGWWKYGQVDNLDVHDNNASWSNGGYTSDHVEGENNMNEEWFGICAKGPTDAMGLYQLYPRAAYYALRQAHSFDPYAPGVDLAALEKHFEPIQPMPFVLEALGDKAAYESEALQLVRLNGMRMELETFSTGGERISTPANQDPDFNSFPRFTGFDHQQSYYFDLEAKPAGNITANLSLNLLGRVATNPIDEIFYENRGRPKTVQGEEDLLVINDNERLKVYSASIFWDHKYFTMDGFYRTGHYHWGYEGDFFGLYPESNYGPNLDIYNGEAPLGVELTGKKAFNGFKVAFGPELWWGANPAILVKYQRKLGLFLTTGIFQEDLDEQEEAVSSIAVPEPRTRKATIHLAAKRGKIGLDLGGIWSGNTKIGDTFQIVDGLPGSYRVLQDKIKDKDTFGGKVKVTVQSGRWNWYAQGAAMGLVADGGWNSTKTFTGWRLTDSGTGNQWNFLTGLAVNLGNWQLAPNFLYQKPVEDPIPNDVQAPGRPRNILDDPFAVRHNRETTAAEMLITFDPTPATWMYSWDSDIKEDAPLAASVGFIYRDYKTTRDANIGILADGRSTFAFPGAPPARKHWEAHGRFISKLSPNLRFIANLYGGIDEPNGSDQRMIHRWGGDLRLASGSYKFSSSIKLNDWGPFDYHRDFNQTFPLQLMGDISTVLGTPGWFDKPQTRLGIRATWRSLDQYSPRYCPTHNSGAGGDHVCDPFTPNQREGSEWEIRTYLHVHIGK